MIVSILHGLEGSSANGFLRQLLSVSESLKIKNFAYSISLKVKNIETILPRYSKSKFLLTSLFILNSVLSKTS